MATKTAEINITGIFTPNTGAPTAGLSNLAFASSAFSCAEYQVNVIEIAAGATETLTPNNTAGSGQTAYLVCANFATAEPVATQTFSVNVDAAGAEVQPGLIAAGGLTTTIAITNNGANTADFHYAFYRRN